MSFDTPAGTRGGRQPRAGLILRLINNNAASRFRRKGKMLGINGLILTTIGARSGAERTSPVGWWPGLEGSWLVVAAVNGAARNPAWSHNIAAHPGNVQIEVEGRRVGVTAEQLHGAERAEAWRQIAVATPASRNTRTRPTVNCRSSAWCPDLGKPLPQPAGASRRCRDLRRGSDCNPQAEVDVAWLAVSRAVALAALAYRAVARALAAGLSGLICSGGRVLVGLGWLGQPCRSLSRSGGTGSDTIIQPSGPVSTHSPSTRTAHTSAGRRDIWVKKPISSRFPHKKTAGSSGSRLPAMPAVVPI